MDAAIQSVSEELARFPEVEGRLGKAFRQTFDQVYDGVHTGRYRWDQLHKTEKTHIGSLVEINLQRQFGFDDGLVLDYRIAGEEVDCKFSSGSQWMIPTEAVGHLCMVTTASDQLSSFSVGLVRASREHLNLGQNKDGKTTLNILGRRAIHWLWQDHPMPANFLLHQPEADVEAVLHGPGTGRWSGQQAVNELFRRFQKVRIPREAVATAGRQADYMKRIRDNGGARHTLRGEGIVIFGHYENHRALSIAVGLDPPGKGESVSARVAPARPGEGAQIDGSWWRLATRDDPPCVAPVLPKGGKPSEE